MAKQQPCRLPNFETGPRSALGTSKIPVIVNPDNYASLVMQGRNSATGGRHSSYSGYYSVVPNSQFEDGMTERKAPKEKFDGLMSQFTDRHKSYEKLAKQGRLKEFKKPQLRKENVLQS